MAEDNEINEQNEEYGGANENIHRSYRKMQ